MSKANNKIRIIDLLNKMANKELRQSTKFKYKNEIFTYARYDKDNPDSDTVTDEKHTKLFTGNHSFNFNDYVEILEDNTEEIEELKRTENVYDMTLECYHDIEKKISNDELADKINEIIRYIKRKDKNE